MKSLQVNTFKRIIFSRTRLGLMRKKTKNVDLLLYIFLIINATNAHNIYSNHSFIVSDPPPYVHYKTTK
jgi:hypothetical protein